MSVVSLISAMLIVVIAASGQQISFIPNGAFSTIRTARRKPTAKRGHRPDRAFFQKLGNQGAAPASVFTRVMACPFSALNVELRFLFTIGQDPISRTVDGFNHNINIDPNLPDAVRFDKNGHRLVLTPKKSLTWSVS